MGGIEYDDSAALYLGAKFPKTEEMRQNDTYRQNVKGTQIFFKTELLILKDRDKEAENVRRSEARMIARRIKSLMRGGVVSDKKKQGNTVFLLQINPTVQYM